MSVDRTAFLDKLMASYEYYYDVAPLDAEKTGGLPLVMFAEFHMCDQGYVLTKRARIWAAESNEYAYIFSSESFDRDTVSRCIDYALADGEPRVKPHPEHKSSYIITIFIADTIDPEAQKEIQGRRFDKSYKLGLHGWSALKTAAVDLKKELIITNKVGRDLRKFFKKLLRSEKV